MVYRKGGINDDQPTDCHVRGKWTVKRRHPSLESNMLEPIIHR